MLLLSGSAVLACAHAWFVRADPQCVCLVSRWAWIAVGYLIGAIVFFHFVIIAAQKWLGPLNTSSAVLSEEALRARDIALYGQEGKGDLGDSVLDVDDEVRSHA